jgi:undecaprenyl diphosphate synthase
MDYSKFKIPNHVAIILDGNGRWAEERGLSRSDGHSHGFENLKDLSEYIYEKGIKVLSVYAFSTENFKRSKEEVDFLMDLFVSKFEEYKKQMNKKEIKIVFSGERKSPLPKKVIKVIENIEEDTKNNMGGILNICINYGGHSEIVSATKKICALVKEGKMNEEEITEENFYKFLFNDLPPVDLLIRTSGEVRLSNFMLYQLSYAEMYFPETYFPAFNNEEFDKAIIEYTRRDRRFGGICYEEKNN